MSANGTGLRDETGDRDCCRGKVAEGEYSGSDDGGGGEDRTISVGTEVPRSFVGGGATGRVAFWTGTE